MNDEFGHVIWTILHNHVSSFYSLTPLAFKAFQRLNKRKMVLIGFCWFFLVELCTHVVHIISHFINPVLGVDRK